jgi:DNA-binding MarR family transcriptional regulator
MVGGNGGNGGHDSDIAELIHELALLGVRDAVRRRKALDAWQRVRLAPSLTATFVKEGRPGFLLFADIARTLAIKGELTVSQIAAITGRTLATASRLVNGLEAAGLVTRRENPDDARSKLIGLTAEGERVVSQLRAAASARLRGRLDRLTPGERRTLGRLLSKLTAPGAAAGGEDGEEHS